MFPNRFFRKNDILWKMIDIYTKKRVPRSAAELSYYIVLSVFPMLICINAMLANLSIDWSGFVSAWEGIIPAEALRVIGNYISYIRSNDSQALIILGISGMAASSSAAFRSIMNIMEDIQGPSRFTGIFRTIFSFGMSLLFLAAVYVSAIIVLLGEWVLVLLNDTFDTALLLGAWKWVRFFIMFLLIYIITYGIYAATAPKENPKVRRMPGAFIAAFLLVAVSIMYSWFISMSIKYTLVYGSIASVIILMVWLQNCGLILIMGNVFNVARGKASPEGEL